MEETLSVLSDDVCERDDKSMGSSCLTVPSAPKRGMRKRSFDDAQSRLKSRKLLGLGGKEASKVLQVLGNCEHLDTKLPRGLSLWLFSSSLMFLAMAILCLFLVRPFSIWLGVDHAPRRNVLEVRLLGATFAGLFCLTFLTSVTSYLVVRNILLCHLVYFGAACLIFLHELYMESNKYVILFLVFHTFILIITTVYLEILWRINRPIPDKPVNIADADNSEELN